MNLRPDPEDQMPKIGLPGIPALCAVFCMQFSALPAQWEPPVRLTFDDSASHTSFNNVHCLAAGGTLHLAWYDRRNGSDQIYYKRSTDNGTTWSRDTALTSGGGTKTDPSVVVAGDHVHLVWEDRRGGYNSQVYYRRSTNDGATWEPETRLNYDGYMSRNPCVAVQGDRVHVAWASDSAGRELYYTRSTDRGASWGGRRRLTFDMQESWHPSLAAVGNVVHLAWRDWRDHGFEVYYLRSTDHGETWDSIPVRLSGDVATGSYNPCLAASLSTVHVIWWDCRFTPFELFYRRSTDYGTTWEPEVRLTNDTTGTYNPSIAAQGQNVCIAWEALYGTSFIMYKYSSDMGANWSADTALTAPPQYWSVLPCIVAGDNGVHIAWTDFRDSEQGEIYYMRNPNSSGAGEGTVNHAPGRRPSATVVRSALELDAGSRHDSDSPRAIGSCPASLLDATGRMVMILKPGPNDVSRLAPGVYFVRGAAEVRTVVVLR